MSLTSNVAILSRYGGWYKGAMPDLRGPKTADVVMKFGGSSLASAEHIERVADIVAQRAKTDRVVVVVSAMARPPTPSWSRPGRSVQIHTRENSTCS